MSLSARSCVTRLAVCLLTGLMLAVPAGCGRRNMATVTGRVTYQGKPVPEAFVMFSPTAGPAAGAVTDASGVYTLLTGGPYGDRVFTGRCRIAVSDANPEGRSRDVRILPRLADAGTSGLVADLVPGENVVNLELPEP
jgi:hypothetical protein